MLFFFFLAGHHQVVHQDYLGQKYVTHQPSNSYGTLPITSVPPLAPLSSYNIRQTGIVAPIPTPTVSPPKTDDDSNSTNQSASSSIYSTNPTTPMDDTENAFAGFEGLLIPGSVKQSSADDDGKDGVKQSHVVNANKMLADLLERKSADPPFNISGDVNNKRKIDSNANTTNDPKRMCTIDSADDDKKMQKTTSTQSAAKLYEKLAASLLEDEDMEVEETTPTQTQPAMATSSIVEQPKPVIMPMQRQIIVSPNNPPQMILTQTQQNNQIGPTTATITPNRTNEYGSGHGFPVIYQHGNPNQIQIQKQIGSMGQQIMQPVIQQQQTQYVLATNQQGQTYLVAQQPTPPVNQILLTQTSQQQGGAPTKTIIILQQAPSNTQTSSHQILGTVNSGTPQKVIMTTQQGQQMIVTQVPRPVQHHVIVNQHQHPSIVTSANVIQTNNPQISTSNQMGTTSITVSSQPQIVPQVQLQQSQAQISLPPPPINQTSHQSMVQIQKQQIQLTPQPSIRQQHTSMQQTLSTATTLINSDKKKVFVTGSGSIEVTPVTQPIINTSVVTQSNLIQQTPQIHQQQQQQSQHMQQHQSTITTQNVQKPQQTVQQSQVSVQPNPVPSPHVQQTQAKPSASNIQQPVVSQASATSSTLPIVKTEEDSDANWLFVCDWRGCQRYLQCYFFHLYLSMQTGNSIKKCFFF